MKAVVLFALALFVGMLWSSRKQGGETTFASSKPDSFDSISKAISTGGIKTLEEVIGFLSPTMRQNYVLMFDSRSVQRSNYLNPRAIVFDDSASLIVAFNDKAFGGGDRVEVMQFRDELQAYEFREIIATSDGLRVSNANPSECTRCHTQALIPNWASYQIWPGAYGESGNQFTSYVRFDMTGEDGPEKRRTVIKQDEYQHFTDFQKAAKGHPRYSLLKQPPNEPLWPFGKQAIDTSFHGDISVKYAPNRHFGVLLNFRMAQALASRIRHSANYEVMPDVIKYTLLRCGERQSSSDDLKREIISTFGASANLSLVDRLGLGVKTGEWNINHFGRNDPYFSPVWGGGINGVFFAGFYQMDTTELVAGISLLASPGQPKEEQQSALKDMGIDANVAEFIFSEVPYISSSALDQEICPKLVAPAWKELGDRSIQSHVVEEIKKGPQPFPEILTKCVGCHVNDPDDFLIPAIPFDSEVALKELVTHGKLLEKLQYRLSSATPSKDQMPPEESSLKLPFDLKARESLQHGVLEYLKTLGN